MSVGFLLKKTLWVLLLLLATVSVLAFSYGPKWTLADIYQPLLSWALLGLLLIYTVPKYGAKKLRSLYGYSRLILYFSLTLFVVSGCIGTYANVTKSSVGFISAMGLMTIVVFIIAGFIRGNLGELLSLIELESVERFRFRSGAALATLVIGTVAFIISGFSLYLSMVLAVFVTFTVLGYLSLNTPIAHVKAVMANAGYKFERPVGVFQELDESKLREYFETKGKYTYQDLLKGQLETDIAQAKAAHTNRMLFHIFVRPIISGILSILVAASIGFTIVGYYIYHFIYVSIER